MSPTGGWLSTPGHWWAWPALVFFMVAGVVGLVRFLALGAYMSAVFMVVWIAGVAMLSVRHRPAWQQHRARRG